MGINEKLELKAAYATIERLEPTFFRDAIHEACAHWDNHYSKMARDLGVSPATITVIRQRNRLSKDLARRISEKVPHLRFEDLYPAAK